MSEAKPLEGKVIAIAGRDSELSHQLRLLGAEVRWWPRFQAKRGHMDAGIILPAPAKRVETVATGMAFKMLERGGGPIIFVRPLAQANLADGILSVGVSMIACSRDDWHGIARQILNPPPAPPPAWHNS